MDLVSKLDDNIFLMCKTCGEHNGSGNKWDGAVGYRNIPVGAVYFNGDKPDSVSISLSEAERMIRSGEVREGDILFPLLIDIIASDGEVG